MKSTETTMKKALGVVVGAPVLLFRALVLIGLAAAVALTVREL
jgi:hypothetical protein